MTKRVLDVGNCAADHASIRDLITSNFDAEIVQAHGPRDSLPALRDAEFHLVLVNRKMDRDGTDGIELIRSMKSDASLSDTPMMLISNYENYQELAVHEGAEPGFGKSELNEASTLEKLRKHLA